jgi:cell division protein FtsQ
MNAESETYPSEALADEEPRYLRRQKPLEIRRRKFARGSWQIYRRWLLAGVGVLAAGSVAYQGTRFFLYSPVVKLANYDQIEITGNHYVNRAAITEKFANDVGKSVLRVPLDARREAIEAIPWIAQARAERTLPNEIRVEVTEREPVAFLRTTNDLALIDANGMILDRPLEGDFRFPVVSGMDDSMLLADREKRMRLLVEFLKDIDLARPGASEQVSEVQLSDPEDVRATLAGLPGLESEPPIAVHFGDSDFVNKYRLLMENIGPWRISAGHVESVDLRFARQVVVNPESVASSRTAPTQAAGAHVLPVRAGAIHAMPMHATPAHATPVRATTAHATQKRVVRARKH